MYKVEIYSSMDKRVDEFTANFEALEQVTKTLCAGLSEGDWFKISRGGERNEDRKNLPDGRPG
jgi:hypothetical protein